MLENGEAKIMPKPENGKKKMKLKLTLHEEPLGNHEFVPQMHKNGRIFFGEQWRSPLHVFFPLEEGE